MRYYTTDRNGLTEMDPPPQRLREILGSVDAEGDPATPDVWLTHHASCWTLSVYPNGFLELDAGDEAEDEGSLCMANQSLENTLRYWRLLAEGDFETLLKAPWQKEGEC